MNFVFTAIRPTPIPSSLLVPGSVASSEIRRFAEPLLCDRVSPASAVRHRLMAGAGSMRAEGLP